MAGYIQIVKKYSALSITTGLLVYIFWSHLFHIFKEWQLDEFSHSFLLPPLSIMMARYELARRKRTAKPSWWGCVIIMIGLSIFILGDISTFRHLSYFSIVITITGLVLTYYGAKITKGIASALFLLVLAVPLPLVFYNPISLQLQLISSSIGAYVIEFLGYSVYREGNLIDLGEYKLQVVEACNGLRYLFPILSLSYFMAYLMKDRVWKKLVLLIATIPITIVINALRIAVIGVTVNLWGQDAAEGLVHILEGYVTFFICLAILAVIVFFLLKIPPAGTIKEGVFLLRQKEKIVTPVYNSVISHVTLVIMALVALFQYSGINSPKHTEIFLSKSLSNFPTYVGQWYSDQDTIEPKILEELRLTDYYLADYSREDNELNINLYIAFYSQQKVGASIHSPMVCLPGSGWKIEHKETVSVTVEGKTTSFPIPVKKLIIKAGNQRLLVYFWFKERNRYVTSKAEAKWYLLLDSFVSGRSDGSLIRLTTPISSEETEGVAEQRLQEFLRSVFSQIEEALP